MRGTILQRPRRQPHLSDGNLLAVQLVMWDAGPRRSGPGPFNFLNRLGCTGKGPWYETYKQGRFWQAIQEKRRL